MQANGEKSNGGEPPLSQSSDTGEGNRANEEDLDQGQSGKPAATDSDSRDLLNQPDERGDAAEGLGGGEIGGEKLQPPPGSTEKPSDDADADIEVLKTVERLPMKSRPQIQTRVIIVKPDGSLPLHKFSVGTIRDSLLKLDRLLELNAKERVNLIKWREDLLIKLDVGQKFNQDVSNEGSRFTPVANGVAIGRTANGALIIRNQQGQDRNVMKIKTSEKKPIQTFSPKPPVIHQAPLERTRGDAARQNVHPGTVQGGGERNMRSLQPKPPSRIHTVKQTVFVPLPPKLSQAPTTARPTSQTGIPFMHLRAREVAHTSGKTDGEVFQSFAGNLLSKPVPSPATLQVRQPIPPPRTRNPKRSFPQAQQNSGLYPPPGGFSKYFLGNMAGLKWTYPPPNGMNMEEGNGAAGSLAPKTRRVSGGTGRGAATTTTGPSSSCQASCGALPVREVEIEIGRRLCDNCLQKSGGFMCSGCAKRYYCSSACQQADWEMHSLYCLP